MNDDLSHVLHILRNPWGHDDNALADARRKGVDAIEALHVALAAATADVAAMRERCAQVCECGDWVPLYHQTERLACARAIRALPLKEA